jgi:hypothetical protein
VGAGVMASPARAGSAVVTNGKFTNIYVLPDPDKETWDQHMRKLRPGDADKFSRASIDKFTAELMSGWPGYFDALIQYNGIHPPRFFGSAVATKKCVDAALKDRFNGVLQWDTVRSLSNCHLDGMDPSPQVNLIFSPDIKIAKILVPIAHGGDMCAESGIHTVAYHAWGLNTPNFTVLPTSMLCMPTFDDFTETLSHEIVETVSDPAGFGMEDFPSGTGELGDNCEKSGKGNPNHLDSVTTTKFKDFMVDRYWSNFDGDCEPRMDPPDGSEATTWVLGEGSPLKRLTGDSHDLNLDVPAKRLVTDAAATQVKVYIQTGGDDLRGGNNAEDNADVALNFKGGSKITINVNRGRSWENGETHSAVLDLPNDLKVSDITGVTIKSHFGGGLSGDNWNVDRVALIVSFPKGSKTMQPAPTIVHDWLNASSNPLIRFTGNAHVLTEPVAAADVGKEIRALDIIISTGNDDLRGGSNAGDNCDVTIELASGKPIVLTNVNRGGNWKNWTSHRVSIPIPKGGLKGGDVKSVKLTTGFGGGIGGDNWNVNQVELKATLK